VKDINGKITRVREGGQAQLSGVEVGMFLQEIAGEKYSMDALQKASSGDSDYEVTFRRNLEAPQTDDVSHAEGSDMITKSQGPCPVAKTPAIEEELRVPRFASIRVPVQTAPAKKLVRQPSLTSRTVRSPSPQARRADAAQGSGRQPETAHGISASTKVDPKDEPKMLTRVLVALQQKFGTAGEKVENTQDNASHSWQPGVEIDACSTEADDDVSVSNLSMGTARTEEIENILNELPFDLPNFKRLRNRKAQSAQPGSFCSVVV
jgi:hypothetical protein